MDRSTTQPQASLAVLIPVYNDSAGLSVSLRSILGAARPAPLHVIVVDDGSATPITVETPTEAGVSLHVHRLVPNQGITSALNAGLKLAQQLGVTYLARLDAGDTVASDRLTRQMALLEEADHIGLVASDAWFSNAAHEHLFRFRAPRTDAEARRRMHINSCILHPTVMLRMSLLPLVGEYSTNYPAAEDYEFFFRMLQSTRFAAVPEPMTVKTLGADSISLRKRRLQLLSRLRIQLKYFRFTVPESYLGVAATCALFAIPNRVLLSFKRKLGNTRL
jgi:glycosyltransferase involved in cell wall biosynthesis